MEVLAFHWPAYRLATVIDMGTASVSLLTAIGLKITLDLWLRRMPPRRRLRGRGSRWSG